jgi:primosomal protein N'
MTHLAHLVAIEETVTNARRRLHVAEDREASHQVMCRLGCKPGASACDTGRALTAKVDAMTCHTCADRGTVQGRPCVDCGTDA